MSNNILYKEFIEGRTTYEHAFMFIGILLQFITFYITGDSVISLVSGVTGIILVVFCADGLFLCCDGKITHFFLFGNARRGRI